METTNTPRKRPVLNFLKKFFGNPLVRGPLKTLPGGNVLYEIGESVQHFIDKRNGKLAAETPAPHNVVSQLLQLIGILGIIYAFMNKWITIEDLLRFTGLGDFSQSVDTVTNITDTLNVH